MTKFKKMISVCFAILLLATVTVAGTLAYENWTAEEYAEMTDETLTVKLVQEQRIYDENGNVTGLEPFADHKILIPLTESAQYDGTNFDKYGMPIAEGYVDQIIRVRNEGTASAYVRVIVAVPAALDDVNNAGHNALHWNLGNRFMPDGDFSETNSTNAAFEAISWKFSEKATVDGIECNIYVFTFNEPLAGGATTDAAVFVGFYLDRNVDIVGGHILLDGVNTGFTDDTVKIHVRAQAVQSYGFASADEAFTTANIPTNPWAVNNH